MKALPTQRIAPPRGWVRFDLRELWEYRELLCFFVWRDIKVRCKQTVIGAASAVIQPFMTMVGGYPASSSNPKMWESWLAPDDGSRGDVR